MGSDFEIRGSKGRRHGRGVPGVLSQGLAAGRAATLGALLCISACHAPSETMRDRVQARIASAPGALVGVAYIDLGSGDTLFINADSVMHAASTMKLPVMMRLYREADNHALSLDRRDSARQSVHVHRRQLALRARLDGRQRHDDVPFHRRFGDCARPYPAHDHAVEQSSHQHAHRACESG